MSIKSMNTRINVDSEIMAEMTRQSVKDPSSIRCSTDDNDDVTIGSKI